MELRQRPSPVNKGWHLLLLLAVVCALTVPMIVFAPTPFTDLGGDTVEPAKVPVRGTVVITRNYEITRDTPLRVTRRMIKGDCKASCELIDLPESWLVLAPGVYRNVKREHIIPSTASPGLWTLSFTLHWKGLLGNERHLNLKEMKIEVVK